MPKHSDLQIHINDEETFVLDKKFISKYCGRMKKMLNHEKRMCHSKTLSIEINDFPGGSEGFELVLRFCYNNGKISITVSNVLLLHCCALFLGMTEEVFSSNLLQQTEIFLRGIYYWTWNELIVSLKNCELFHTYADNCGLLENIIGALLAKMDQNFEGNLFISSSSSSPSSPESNYAKTFSCSTQDTLKTVKSSLANKEWWFEDLATLPPKIIEKILQIIGAYKTDNNNPILTRFLLHYLKKVTQTEEINCHNSVDYAGLAETAVCGITFAGNKSFSCRVLFWVLRIVSRFGMRRDCRIQIEKLIGGVLDQATLDDLLVSGHHMGLSYDVTSVARLIKQFVYINGSDGEECAEKLKKLQNLYLVLLGTASMEFTEPLTFIFSLIQCWHLRKGQDCADA
ncbi:BTB/POZ domain-containing protein At1g50280-like isoform X2 [Vigna unguiculata]|uniref:BTB/POZ domain-containing protein At1g50280-like isoform X2 n=1 Tax=Vigna unguiculata TaxID=3917 RepID=UPI0010169E2C|nr:BTB/POZ domain-containing protein At1g50280-like isoform X2 [Vigna unguiculata]